MQLASTPLFAKGGTYDLAYLNLKSDHYDSSRQFAFLRSYEGKGALVVANFADHDVDVRVDICDAAFEHMGIAKDDRFFETIHVASNDATIILTD